MHGGLTEHQTAWANAATGMKAGWSGRRSVRSEGAVCHATVCGPTRHLPRPGTVLASIASPADVTTRPAGFRLFYQDAQHNDP